MSHLVRSIGGGLGRAFWTLLSASFLANLSDGIFCWGSLPLGALLGGIVGQTFGLPAVFIFAAAVHGLLLSSRLILNDAFMAEVEEQARANVLAQSAG